MRAYVRARVCVCVCVCDECSHLQPGSLKRPRVAINNIYIYIYFDSSVVLLAGAAAAAVIAKIVSDAKIVRPAQLHCKTRGSHYAKRPKRQLCIMY